MTDQELSTQKLAELREAATGWPVLAALVGERDTLAAAVGRVRALHPRGTVEMITATDCVNEDCEHEGDCPTEPVEACRGCVDFAELATLYALEHADVQDRVAWPCAHIRALDGRHE